MLKADLRLWATKMGIYINIITRDEKCENMNQSQSPDGVVNRLVDYSSVLSSPRDIDLMDDAVGVIRYLVRQNSSRDEIINGLNADMDEKNKEISRLVCLRQALLNRHNKAIDILSGELKEISCA